MTHRQRFGIKECVLPRVWWRRKGSTYTCDCGEIFKVGYVGAFDGAIKVWMDTSQ